MTLPELANLQIDLEARVLHLRIDRPERRNALDLATRAALTDGVDWAAASDEVGVVVISGNGGKAFASGADLAEGATLDAEAVQAQMAGRRVYDAIAECPRPVFAMIDGWCLGGGCELALSCDLRIASNRSKLGQPEVGLGIIPGGGATQRLPRLVGPGHALRLILSGEIIDADEALRLGLVEQVVAPDELEATTAALAATLAARSPVALGLAKRAVRASMELPLSAGLALERELMGVAMASEDATEGIAAFLEKRAPEFGGR
ncbi:MAG: enoyl-CoA hydratase-related protein [Acidimicrobiales bacterium]